jgi:hypothetical protein
MDAKICSGFETSLVSQLPIDSRSYRPILFEELLVAISKVSLLSCLVHWQLHY